MIGMFIGGFFVGAFVTFGVLVLCAVISIKKKQKQVLQRVCSVKFDKGFKPYIPPIILGKTNLKGDHDNVKKM